MCETVITDQQGGSASNARDCVEVADHLPDIGDTDQDLTPPIPDCAVFLIIVVLNLHACAYLERISSNSIGGVIRRPGRRGKASIPRVIP